MSAGDGPSGRERLRYHLAANRTLVLGACLLLVLLGGWVAVQAHTGPDTTTEERVAGRWTTNASVDHGAVVRQESLAFDEGQVLQNRSVYFSQVTPILNGSIRIDHAGSPADVSTTTDLRLVLRSVRGSENGQVLWSRSENLDTVEATGAGTVRVPFRVNVSERINRTFQIQNSLGTGLGQPQILLVADTRSEATLAGESVTQTRTDSVRVRPRSGFYEVVPAPGERQTESVSETVTVPVETDPLRAYGSLVVVLLGLVGAAAFAWLDRSDRLDVPPATAAAMQRASERDSFDEWISRGRVPDAGADERVVDVASLEDLVDVAIDSERRVIESPDGDEFVVLDGTTRYRYRGAAAGGSPSTAEKIDDGQRGETGGEEPRAEAEPHSDGERPEAGTRPDDSGDP